MKVLYFTIIGCGFDIELSHKACVLYKHYSGHANWKVWDDFSKELPLPYSDGTYNRFGDMFVIPRHDPILIRIVEELGHDAFCSFRQPDFDEEEEDVINDDGEILSTEEDFEIHIEEVPDTGYFLYGNDGDWKGDEHLVISLIH